MEGRGRKRSAWMATQESGEEDRAGERRGGCRSKVRVGRWKVLRRDRGWWGNAGRRWEWRRRGRRVAEFWRCLVGSERTEGSSQELVEQPTLHDPYPVILQSLSHTGVSVAIYVGNEHLHEVSNSVSLAENWVRTHVLSHYPATKLTTIVLLEKPSVCNRNQEHQISLVLPSVKNLFHSLTRWGLERETTVSASLSSDCLNASSASYRDDLADKSIRPLLDFLQNTNSTYLENPAPKFSNSPEETLKPSSAAGWHRFSVAIFSLLTPKSPPYGFNWPPCNPSGGRAAPNLPCFGVWCVAKPSVPAEKLQEAMDYACGEGEADCEVIRPQGNCYSPDTVVAHASYWQKNKRVGGTCSFGGTAILIIAEPSKAKPFPFLLLFGSFMHNLND
ncbi:hypothetical protein Acr_02g0013100 [Actinidia rufa]|uniref:X8 domain-containing protein n=1 Tax=Actinidia rufa TaxID=165716 RepID=A0A7J0E9J0_9ERIC|nr:hypothetical protein Acr_02g0013100 [Actinidia rufa]